MIIMMKTMKVVMANKLMMHQLQADDVSTTDDDNTNNDIGIPESGDTE